ncbi:MAG: imidazole glycerol phosphate synthase subunit HisH [Planctomycetes bacterium]|nr:imidazole glycerol phosphate synthase subunit HisH [Planctomycetota bacterium]
MSSVPCITTGVANTASVRAALRRLGRELVAATPADVRDADLLIVPGVGHYAAAAAQLRADALTEPLRERVARGRPTLGICLGMQLLCDGSDEAPGVAGVGALPGRLRRFPAGVRRPQMGWNTVAAADVAPGVVTTGQAWFANSFALPAGPRDGWRIATTTHGFPFVAAAERGAVVLCQFHPELSGAYGSELLGRWLRLAARPEEAAC